MSKQSKRMRAAIEQVDSERTYQANEAIDLLKSLPGPKFDESVELAVALGIDPRKTDQLVRGAVALPNGLGKTIRVIVFAEGDKADAAKEAGADEVGSEDLAARIESGWMDFDVVITSPDMMKHVGKLGRVLGPQGKMPSPKSGTVTPDVAAAVTEFKAGKVEFRTDSGGNVHAAVGKRSFDTEKLTENIDTFLNHLSSLRPSAVKGQFVKRVALSTSMGPRTWISYGG